MFGLVLAVSAALAMSPKEAVDATIARSPALDVSDGRIAEAEARLHEVTGHLLPTIGISGGLTAQTKIEVNFAESLPLPDPSLATPVLVQPGLQLSAGAQLFQPIVAPGAWIGRDAAKAGIVVATTERDADETRVARRALEAWHQAAFAHESLEVARTTEELATRLAEKGDALLALGAVSEADVIPFQRAAASARANTALAEQSVLMADGILRTLTGLDGVADAPVVPPAPPSVEELIATMDRPDVRAAAQRIEAAHERVKVERTGLYPTMGLNASLSSLNPSSDIGAPVVWRVGVGATIPIFQGGSVGARVDTAQAQEAQAEAGERAVLEAAEIEVRMAYGALASALASLDEQDEAVRLAEEATKAAEHRVDQGGGSLLDLQQAQLEQFSVEFRRTQARSEAARAADMLALAVHGTL